MALPEPKAKKQCKLPRSLPFPIVLKKDGDLKKILGYFNGFSVIVDDPDDMKTIISMGYFGKASFSRSYPQFSRDNQTKIVRQRQYETRKACFEKFPGKTKPSKIIVIPDSDSENEDYFTNLRPKYNMDYSGLKEKVFLSLEEAFFLMNTVKCLRVTHNDLTLDDKALWSLFASTESLFIRNYMAYFYYRGKNWVVKPGLKFGGDFMLYKEGPPFYHATYVVIIEVVDETGSRIESLTNRQMDNTSVLGLNRLCETAGKELLLCRMKWPSNNQISYENLTNIEIEEILIKRWIPSQEREDTEQKPHTCKQ